VSKDLFKRIKEAHLHIRPQVAVTPLLFSPMLSKVTGCQVYLKCEHLQHTGAFKFRGATNKVRLLDSKARNKGVITASSGNHGQGVALAGRLVGASVTVYASSIASPLKLDAIRALGAEVIVLDDTPLAVELEAGRQAKLKGMTFISPYNDIDIIAGQGTAGIEIVEQADTENVKLAAAFVSMGGGGLLSGVGTAIQHLSPETAVVGCSAANSTALYSSLKAGKIVEVEEFETISDGTAGGLEPGSITFDFSKQVVSDTCLVTEEEIRAAMKLIVQTDRWMIEGAAGVAVASLLKFAPKYQGSAIVAIICGRNIMLEKFIEAVK